MDDWQWTLPETKEAEGSDSGCGDPMDVYVDVPRHEEKSPPSGEGGSSCRCWCWGRGSGKSPFRASIQGERKTWRRLSRKVERCPIHSRGDGYHGARERIEIPAFPSYGYGRGEIACPPLARQETKAEIGWSGEDSDEWTSSGEEMEEDSPVEIISQNAPLSQWQASQR